MYMQHTHLKPGVQPARGGQPAIRTHAGKAKQHTARHTCVPSLAAAAPAVRTAVAAAAAAAAWAPNAAPVLCCAVALCPELLQQHSVASGLIGGQPLWGGEVQGGQGGRLRVCVYV